MNTTQIEILDRASEQERARQSQAPPRVQESKAMDAFLEKIRATRAAVKDQEVKLEVRVCIEKMKQNQAPPRVQDTRSTAAPRVQKAPPSEAVDAFLEKIRKRALVADQAAKRLQVKAKQTNVEKFI